MYDICSNVVSCISVSSLFSVRGLSSDIHGNENILNCQLQWNHNFRTQKHKKQTDYYRMYAHYQFGIKWETKNGEWQKHKLCDYWILTNFNYFEMHRDKNGIAVLVLRNGWNWNWFVALRYACMLHMNKHWVDLIWIWCKTIFAFSKQTNKRKQHLIMLWNWALYNIYAIFQRSVAVQIVNRKRISTFQLNMRVLLNSFSQ